MDLRASLGIDLPVIQAPMAGVQGSALAIAVCGAGGLGSLPCAVLDGDGVLLAGQRQHPLLGQPAGGGVERPCDGAVERRGDDVPVEHDGRAGAREVGDLACVGRIERGREHHRADGLAVEGQRNADDAVRAPRLQHHPRGRVGGGIPGLPF